MLTNCCASFIGVSRATEYARARAQESTSAKPRVPNRACQTALDSIPPLEKLQSRRRRRARGPRQCKSLRRREVAVGRQGSQI